MATLAAISYGFVLSSSTTQGGAYTPLAAVEEIKPPKISTDEIKIQTNDSPTLYGEQIPGWNTASPLEATIVYDKTQANTIYGFFRTSRWWKVVKPDGTSTGSFQGFISEIGDEMPMKDKMLTTIKITVNGAYTFVGSP